MQSNETQIQQKATAGMQSRGMAPLMCNTQDTWAFQHTGSVLL